MSQPQHFILASRSPRRCQLLQQQGYAFEVRAPSEQAESEVWSHESPPQHVARLAVRKAQDVAGRVDDGLIVACDTVVACQGQILGKPLNRAHACEMLTLLRGHRHQVYSGLCLWHCPSNRHRVEVDVSELVMDDISDQQLDAYLQTRAWQGKAGAFGYQDGLDWVHLIQGSPSNVVGLPLETLERMIAEFTREENSHE